MSKLTESFRTIKVFNPHEFYGKGNVYIAYNAADYGRGGRGGPTYSVHRPGYETDPDGPWYRYGAKHFALHRHPTTKTLKEARAVTLAEAQEWAGKRYGITEWARDPYGGYGEAEFVKARVKELKAAVKAAIKDQP